MSSELPLGKETSYTFAYNPDLLFPIPRQEGRRAAGLDVVSTVWLGEDIWNIYELSWLDPAGKPQVAIGELRVPASSVALIESKSLKLYCNSFSMSRFESADSVREVMERDLGQAAGSPVTLSLVAASEFCRQKLTVPKGFCLDELDIAPTAYLPDPTLLTTSEEPAEETLFSHLFRSCCPVTGQPDWATVTVRYRGCRISGPGLLAYLISFRQHTGFHEACVETIFADILNHCRPDELTVSARFTRRGGIDINPYRSTSAIRLANLRDPRQ